MARLFKSPPGKSKSGNLMSWAGPAYAGYTNVEGWLNRTDPTQFVDYRTGENNRSSLR